MLTELLLLIKKNSGILAVIGGSLIENLFGPSLIGWGFILLGLGYEWIWPHRNYKTLPLIFFILILAAWGLLSLWVTADLDLTVPAVSRHVASLVCFVAIVCWLKTQPDFEYFGFGLIGLGSFLSIASPFIIEFQQNKGGFIPDSFYHQLPLLLSNPVHPNIMATILLMLFPIGFVYALACLAQPLTWKVWLAIIGTFLMMLMLFLTRSRGGYLVGGIGMVLILGALGYRKIALLGGTGVVVVVLALIAIEPASTDTAVDALANTNTLGFRLLVWELALNILRDFPLTGVGMGAFNVVGERLYPFPPFADPGAHNLFFQIGVDLGLPALIAYLYLTLYLVWKSRLIRIANSGDEKSLFLLGAWIGLILMLLHGLIDPTVWGTRMHIMPWFLMAFLMAKIVEGREA
ncbi:MAG: O-antigen ligase family protein [Chloroflexota bacterium]